MRIDNQTRWDKETPEAYLTCVVIFASILVKPFRVIDFGNSLGPTPEVNERRALKQQESGMLRLCIVSRRWKHERSCGDVSVLGNSWRGVWPS